jgi:hypothetical protein
MFKQELKNNSRYIPKVATLLALGLDLHGWAAILLARSKRA